MKAEEIETALDVEKWLTSFPDELAMKYARVISIRVLIRNLDQLAGSTKTLGQCLTIFKVLVFGLNAAENMTPHGSALRLSISRELEAYGNGPKDFFPAILGSAFDVFAATEKTRALSAIRAIIITNSVLEDAVLPETKVSNPIILGRPEFGNSSQTFVVGITNNLFSDIQLINNQVDVLSSQLYHSNTYPELSSTPSLSELAVIHSGFLVLTSIFENALYARPQNWPLLTALAEKDEAFWTGTDTEVLDRIAEVMDNFERLRLLGETHSIKGLIEQALPDGAASAFQRSHNNPPELIENADPPQQVLIIWAGLDQVEHELTKEKPDKALLAEIAGWVKRAFFAILKKCADWADKGVSAFTIAFGTGLAGIVLNELFVSGRLAEYIEQLIKFASGG